MGKKLFSIKFNLRDALKSSGQGKIVDHSPRNSMRIGNEVSSEISGGMFYDCNAENAIQQRKRVLLKYKNEKDEISERKVDIYFSKFGCFFGWCHLRQQPRTFKLENVLEWKILDESFEWNEDTADKIRKKAFESY